MHRRPFEGRHLVSYLFCLYHEQIAPFFIHITEIFGMKTNSKSVQKTM